MSLKKKVSTMEPIDDNKVVQIEIPGLAAKLQGKLYPSGEADDSMCINEDAMYEILIPELKNYYGIDKHSGYKMNSDDYRKAAIGLAKNFVQYRKGTDTAKTIAVKLMVRSEAQRREEENRKKQANQEREKKSRLKNFLSSNQMRLF